jgi:hypothetical protein
MKQASLCSSIVQGGGKRYGANPSSSAFASFRSSVSKASVNQPYADASGSRACCATSPSGASGPRRQPVTLIPDRDGVAARHVLRLPSRQQRSPPTPMLSRAPSACASALGVPCTSPLHCPDCDRIAPVRGHYRAGASELMLTMLIDSSTFRIMRTFRKALRCGNALTKHSTA